MIHYAVPKRGIRGFTSLPRLYLTSRGVERKAQSPEGGQIGSSNDILIFLSSTLHRERKREKERERKREREREREGEKKDRERERREREKRERENRRESREEREREEREKREEREREEREREKREERAFFAYRDVIQITSRLGQRDFVDFPTTDLLTGT
jgi:hypothetical protein